MSVLLACIGMPPILDLHAVCTCHRCGRPRDMPDVDEARTLMRGSELLVLRSREKCAQCGDDRVDMRVDFGLGE